LTALTFIATQYGAGAVKEDSAFKIRDSGRASLEQDSGFRIRDSGRAVSNFEFRISSFEFRISSFYFLLSAFSGFTIQEERLGLAAQGGAYSRLSRRSESRSPSEDFVGLLQTIAADRL